MKKKNATVNYKSFEYDHQKDYDLFERSDDYLGRKPSS